MKMYIKGFIRISEIHHGEILINVNDIVFIKSREDKGVKIKVKDRDLYFDTFQGMVEVVALIEAAQKE